MNCYRSEKDPVLISDNKFGLFACIAALSDSVPLYVYYPLHVFFFASHCQGRKNFNDESLVKNSVKIYE